jgi:diguanylate cyclase (GGDEF)-like protein
LDQGLADARRRGGSLAVLFLDLDRFKVINDSLGHDVGDEVLVAASRRIQGVLSIEDTLARFGGDEFSVLLPQRDRARPPLSVANEILAALSEPIYIMDQSLHVHASVGIARYPHDGNDPRWLIKQADAAMYEAKTQGGNRAHLASPRLGRTVQNRSELERDLPVAIGRDLFLEFQPIVHMEAEEVWGFEALVRWRHPRQGIISPSNFVPLAEQIGLAPALDQWVLHEACQQMSDFACDLPRDCYLCVNVCPPHLHDYALPRTVRTVLDATAMDESRLVIEVSERAVSDDAGRMSGMLNKLRSQSVSVALDDFGAGSTSLAQLGELTLDYLKLDKRFVSKLTGDGPLLSIVAAVTRLADTLGVMVIAEGIETQTQRHLLLDAGCTLGQGFLFAHPQPISTLRPIAQTRGNYLHRQ